MEKSKKGLISKILIPVLIVAAVAAIWIVKSNSGKKPSIEIGEDTLFALEVTEVIDMDELKSHGLPILIDFGADQCIPCKQMAPVLKELNQELQGKAIILFVDVWKYPTLANDYPISLIPTQVLITSEGKPYTPSVALGRDIETDNNFTTHVGGMDKTTMLAMLKEMGMKE